MFAQSPAIDSVRRAIKTQTRHLPILMAETDFGFHLHVMAKRGRFVHGCRVRLPRKTISRRLAVRLGLKIGSSLVNHLRQRRPQGAKNG